MTLDEIGKQQRKIIILNRKNGGEIKLIAGKTGEGRILDRYLKEATGVSV
jgi:hypothetical protein